MQMSPAKLSFHYYTNFNQKKTARSFLPLDFIPTTTGMMMWKTRSPHATTLSILTMGGGHFR